MPWAAPTVCTWPGCGKLVPKPGRCDRHRKQGHQEVYAARRARGDLSVAVYSTAAWRRTRADQLRREPLCRACRAEGRVVPALVCDHIVPVKQGGAFWDPSNLQSLCNLCHERKSWSEGSRARGRTPEEPGGAGGIDPA